MGSSPTTGIFRIIFYYMQVQIHDKLNPKIWEWAITKTSREERYFMHPEVHDKLLQIGEAFIDFLEIPKDAVVDIRLLGSSANYNYTSHSDIDLHIVVDFEKVHKDCPVVQGYLWAQKALFNKEHDITIYGIPVELYAESSKDHTASNGIYSVKNHEWISKPTYPDVSNINDLAVTSKFDELKKAIEDTNSQEEAQTILDKIYRLRKSGLEQAGELSTENLVFKKLRDAGLIDTLKQQVRTSFDKEMSLGVKESYKGLVQYLAQSSLIDYLNM